MKTKDLSFEARFAAALGKNGSNTLPEFARELKAEGRSQSEVYDLYLQLLRKYLGAAYEARFNAVYGAMDVIAGRCQKSRRIFAGRL